MYLVYYVQISPTLFKNLGSASHDIDSAILETFNDGNYAIDIN